MQIKSISLISPGREGGKEGKKESEEGYSTTVQRPIKPEYLICWTPNKLNYKSNRHQMTRWVLIKTKTISYVRVGDN